MSLFSDILAGFREAAEIMDNGKVMNMIDDIVDRESFHSNNKKGPFWVIPVISHENGKEIYSYKLISYPVDREITPVPSHKSVWNEVKAEYSVSWNYFPRGRVEICRDATVVYANPSCFSWSELETELRKAFDLENVKIIFKADNSAHYKALL